MAGGAWNIHPKPQDGFQGTNKATLTLTSALAGEGWDEGDAIIPYCPWQMAFKGLHP